MIGTDSIPAWNIFTFTSRPISDLRSKSEINIIRKINTQHEAIGWETEFGMAESRCLIETMQLLRTSPIDLWSLPRKYPTNIQKLLLALLNRCNFDEMMKVSMVAHWCDE